MPFPQWKIPDLDLESHKCLVQMLTGETLEWMLLHRFYTKGVLIFGGGLYDQPVVYREAMRVITGRCNKLEADKKRG